MSLIASFVVSRDEHQWSSEWTERTVLMTSKAEGGVGTSPHRAMPATGSEPTPAGNFEDTCHSNDDGDVMRSSSTSALALSLSLV